jgi:hypothetical protein
VKKGMKLFFSIGLLAFLTLVFLSEFSFWGSSDNKRTGSSVPHLDYSKPSAENGQNIEELESQAHSTIFKIISNYLPFKE